MGEGVILEVEMVTPGNNGCHSSTYLLGHFLFLRREGNADPRCPIGWSFFFETPHPLLEYSPRICEGGRLKSTLGDETIEVTKLGSGDLVVELRSNDQAKKLGAIATFLDIPVIDSPQKSLNCSKGAIRSRDLRCCSEEEMVEELSGEYINRFQPKTYASGIKTQLRTKPAALPQRYPFSGSQSPESSTNSDISQAQC
ncbi:hypothetical protein PoB_001908200 [Plakobranchus ocellatus]|uniref:Uncharacterized protein n=1 Tax=Plakobranchus ocellatus TaxID=259542 RepID=A0AAV3ZDM7_9GAST|nr:hypothetical protein PoB_001908200 [Plakobranchus ocellatus]